jgi:hypothetical protein
VFLNVSWGQRPDDSIASIYITRERVSIDTRLDVGESQRYPRSEKQTCPESRLHNPVTFCLSLGQMPIESDV